MVLILIPAAGGSSRMRGRDKLLEQIDGESVLRRQTRAAVETGAEVLVTLPPAGDRRAGAVAGIGAPRLSSVRIAAAAEGMAASLREGARVARAAGADALIVLLPDMPEIETGDLRRLVAARDGRAMILRGASEDGRPGHPVLFEAPLLPAFERLTGDSGAAAIVNRHRARTRLVPLPGQRALRDLDTPEAWAAWRRDRR